MKRLKNLKKMMEEVQQGNFSKQEFSKLQMDVHAQLKQHVLKGICTYCGGKVFKKKFKTLGEKHDYHMNGMCHACMIELHKEPKREEDLKWQH